MGALHEGHLNLIRACVAKCDITVATIFVNPTQFNNPDDLKKYPRKLEQDLQLLKENGCDVVFAPEQEELYPEAPSLNMNFGSLEHLMEGKHRPGHFSGVGLVVAKLFNIVQPDTAFFGQKDLQQFHVIKKLVDQLNFPIELVMIPTVRERDGLAMSSRNERLGIEQRAVAPSLFAALNMAAEKIKSSIPLNEVRHSVEEYFNEIVDIELEYFEVVTAETLAPVAHINKGDRLALCLACHLGEIRLIDNILIEV